MKIKSAKSFRFWYKSKIKEIERNDPVYNENFVGTYHKENGKKTIKGFFEMYHGDKPDIASYLPSILKIAEDGQAIYEFLQNAVDCGSTHFYIFYNENYFLAINNGNPFDIEGLQSILNIAQTTKKDPDKIGRFGIGFKLAHRLVGKNEGTDELVNHYKGPILFSWAKLEDLESLLANEQIQPITPHKGVDNGFYDAPYLLKLLLTNFPSDPNEIVKDINYKDKILFPKEELNELIEFLNENFKTHAESLKKNVLNQGSLFFIKLGEDKKKLLDKDYSELVNGIQYSMNTLKKLQKVYINNYDIGKIPLQLEEGTIKRGSDEFENISPEYKEFDIKFAIGFNTIKFGIEKSYEQIKLLKAKPNFYKYFPMGDEINGLGFIVHCDSFSNEANRRKLHEDDINRKLFPELAKHITQKLETYKLKDRNKFLNLYASILLSDVPDRQNNKWLRPIFYDFLLNSLQKNIPTKKGFSCDAQNVKINKLKLELNLTDFGLPKIEWFEWDNAADKDLLDEAQKLEKIGIESWDITKIVENANLENINNWIVSCDPKTYHDFLNELEKSYLRKETKEKICQIKLIKFSNNKFYSFDEVISAKDIFGKTTYRYNNCFFDNSKTREIKNELTNLKLIVSKVAVEDYPKIFASITLPEEKKLYEIISEKCKTNTLTALEKKNLFLNLSNEPTKFNNVTEGTLMDLRLFCDNNEKIQPLSSLIGNIKTISWLNAYKIKNDEYFPELNSYLITNSETIFKEIYKKNQVAIHVNIKTIEDLKSLIRFYRENQKLFFSEYIIHKDGAALKLLAKTSNRYQIRPPNKVVRKFIEENLNQTLSNLPFDFDEECKDDVGIIRGGELYELILNYINIDTYKEQLVDIIPYDEHKRSFLSKLSKVTLKSNQIYSIESYEYKVLSMACDILNNDISEFRSKIIINTENKDIKLNEVPHFSDKIIINSYELSLAKILPNNYENSGHLSHLISHFIALGLNKETIEKLFGISEEPKLSEIFQLFTKQVKTLENAEQLAFTIIYSMYVEEIDFSQFKVQNIDEEVVDIGTNKYLTHLNFIKNSEILHEKYEGITKIIKQFPIKTEANDNLLLLNKPFFDSDIFICPCIKDELSEVDKLSLVEFLFNQWKINKISIQNIDWTKINDKETKNILDFNPTTSVYPGIYAYDEEVLPDYLIEWIGNDVTKIEFITDLGVWTENSVIVELRKYLIGDSEDFQINRLQQETRFNENEIVLFNSFELLKEKEINLKDENQISAFKEMVRVINSNRAKGQELIIQDPYNFPLLEAESIKWKTIEEFTIHLFKGPLPKIIKLDEIQDYVFYNCNDGDYVVNAQDIYINDNEDRTLTLQKVALDSNNYFTTEDLKDIELSILKEELNFLKKHDQTEEDNINSTFLDDVNDFISEIEETEWNNYVPELKNILELSISHPKEKQKLFNLIAKIKLAKELNAHFEIANKDYNHLSTSSEKYFVHSARGAFAYIHPNEILKMKDEGYKMALDFNTKSKIKIYDTAEEILQLNSNHILAYQNDKTMEELFTFCRANRDAHKHLLIIDKNNSGEKSRALLKLLNIEDDYQ